MIPWLIGGLGALGLGGIYVMSRRPSAHRGPGGQGLSDSSNVGTLNDPNIGLNVGVDELSAGPNLSFTDPSFFGDGLLSVWSAGPMDYSQGGGGPFRHGHNRGRRGGSGDNGPGFPPIGGDFPPGAGGFGSHHGKGPHFPPAPAGGEGFDNGGQGYYGGSQPARNGGNPWQQQTTMGAQGQQYLVQKGDTINGIARKVWGPGSDGTPIQQANAGALSGVGSNGQLSAGLILSIPGAGQSGPPAPGGPAGNGVGGGSVGADGFNPGQAAATPTGVSATQANPGAGTSSAGAPGGGSPTTGQSWGNSSRARRGNAAQNYAMSGAVGGDQAKKKRGNR